MSDASGGDVLSDETLAREELGIVPQELEGSAWEAAVTSFLLFAAGAAVPLAGFIFVPTGPAVPVSPGVSAVGLFVLGAATSLLTGRSVAFTGSRQVLFGRAAAGVTFGLDHLFQVTIAG